jgi:small subunit ribosomal protein S5
MAEKKKEVKKTVKKPVKKPVKRDKEAKKPVKKEVKKLVRKEEPKKVVKKKPVEEEKKGLEEIIESPEEKSVEEAKDTKVVEKKFRRGRRRTEEEEWVPKTELGKKVKNGEVASLEQVYSLNLPILEFQITDRLVPNLDEEILQVKPVQRVTDSGRKNSFFVVAVVGNRNGSVGLGRGRGPSVRPAIDNAIRDAKKHILSIRRGCGSWECRCGKPHTLPFKVIGKFGSVKAEFIPAPRGTGLVVGDKAKKVLTLAGIDDAWGKTEGKTATTLNYAQATIEALKQTRRMRLMEEQEKITEVC